MTNLPTKKDWEKIEAVNIHDKMLFGFLCLPEIGEPKNELRGSKYGVFHANMYRYDRNYIHYERNYICYEY